MNWPHHRFWIQLRPDKHFRCVGVKQRWQGKRSSGRLLKYISKCLCRCRMINIMLFGELEITARFTWWNGYSLVSFITDMLRLLLVKISAFQMNGSLLLNEWKPAFYMNGSLVNDYVAIRVLHYGHETVPPCPVFQNQCNDDSATNDCCVPRWRHQMETYPALLAICAGNSPVTGEFPAPRPVTRGFDVFFDLRVN